MSLRDRLQDDLKDAMRKGDKLRLSVIRLIKAGITNHEIAKGHTLDDSEVLEIIAKELKQRHDTLPDYERAGRSDILERLHQEMDVIREYLPEQLSEEALRQIVADAKAETGASTPKEMGRLMGAVMPKVKGRADGNLVNRLVREALSE